MIHNTFGKPTRTITRDKNTIMEWKGTQAAIGIIIMPDKHSGLKNASIILTIQQLKKTEEKDNE